MKELVTEWEVEAIGLGDRHPSPEGHCVVSKKSVSIRMDILTWETNDIHAYYFHNKITENKANKNYIDQ